MRRLLPAFALLLLLAACSRSGGPGTASLADGEAEGDTTTVGFDLPAGSIRVPAQPGEDAFLLSGLTLPEAVSHFRTNLQERGFEEDSTSQTKMDGANLVFNGNGKRMTVRVEQWAADSLVAIVAEQPDTSFTPPVQ